MKTKIVVPLPNHYHDFCNGKQKITIHKHYKIRSPPKKIHVVFHFWMFTTTNSYMHNVFLWFSQPCSQHQFFLSTGSLQEIKTAPSQSLLSLKTISNCWIVSPTENNDPPILERRKKKNSINLNPDLVVSYPQIKGGKHNKGILSESLNWNKKLFFLEHTNLETIKDRKSLNLKNCAKQCNFSLPSSLNLYYKFLAVTWYSVKPTEELNHCFGKAWILFYLFLAVL